MFYTLTEAEMVYDDSFVDQKCLSCVLTKAILVYAGESMCQKCLSYSPTKAKLVYNSLFMQFLIPKMP